MSFTHIYDFVLKIISLIMAVLACLPLTDVLYYPMTIVFPIFVIYFAVYQFFMSYFSAYLYCRFRLKMQVSVLQMIEIKKVISPTITLSQTWPKLLEVRGYANDKKFEVAETICLQELASRQENKTERIAMLKSSTRTTKYVLGIQWILAFYLTLAALLNLPPANYISNFLDQMFGPQEFYPLVNTIILLLAIKIIFEFLHPAIKPFNKIWSKSLDDNLITR